MTYRELKELLNNTSDEVLDQDATVFVPGVDEYLPIKEVTTTDEDEDVLDPGHLVLLVK